MFRAFYVHFTKRAHNSSLHTTTHFIVDSSSRDLAVPYLCPSDCLKFCIKGDDYFQLVLDSQTRLWCVLDRHVEHSRGWLLLQHDSPYRDLAMCDYTVCFWRRSKLFSCLKHVFRCIVIIWSTTHPHLLLTGLSSLFSQEAQITVKEKFYLKLSCSPKTARSNPESHQCGDLNQDFYSLASSTST